MDRPRWQFLFRADGVGTAKRLTTQMTILLLRLRCRCQLDPFLLAVFHGSVSAAVVGYDSKV